MTYHDEDRPTGRDMTNNFTAMAERSERSGARTQTATRWMLLAAFVLVVAAVGMATVVQDISDNVESNRVTAEETQDQVDHLEDFVNELETSTPEEQQQNAAVSQAVAQVPEIKAILCEEFPEASACQVP